MEDCLLLAAVSPSSVGVACMQEQRADEDHRATNPKLVAGPCMQVASAWLHAFRIDCNASFQESAVHPAAGSAQPPKFIDRWTPLGSRI